MSNVKRILEHPQIYVVKPEDKAKFSVIPSPPQLELKQRPQQGSKDAQKSTEENAGAEELAVGTGNDEAQNEGDAKEEGEEGEDEEQGGGEGEGEDQMETNCEDAENEHEEIPREEYGEVEEEEGEEGEVFDADNEHQEE